MEPRAAVSRPGLIAAALQQLDSGGLPSLSMRTLADRLGIKAASLYWHLRDRDELLAMLAAELTGAVADGQGGRGGRDRAQGWRGRALATCEGFRSRLEARRDAALVVLAVPGALAASEVGRQLAGELEAAGLDSREAIATASLMLAHVLFVAAGAFAAVAAPATRDGALQLAIDTGSRGVRVRAGAGMAEALRAPNDPSTAAPAIQRGDVFKVRRVRGTGHGALEVNPAYPWRFRVQAPTWNTELDLTGIDVRELHIDSGAARVTALLPMPRGRVPISVSGGTVDVVLRRPVGAGCNVDVSGGVMHVRLDGKLVHATAADLHWARPGAASADGYDVKVSSGALRVTVEEDASLPSTPAGVAAGEKTGPSDPMRALQVVLDGIQAGLPR